MGDAAGTPAFCPALETLAFAYHEAGHAVAQLLVYPPLPLTSASIVPEDDEHGRDGGVARGQDRVQSDSDSEAVPRRGRR